MTKEARDHKDLKIIFMGTPEFAVASLRILVEAGYHVVAVVTVPDKPAGRGKKLKASPVKEYALEKGIPLLQPVKLRDPAFNQALKDLAPDLMVVVAFRMLPEMVWSLPRIGTFNLHASLLPDYRGAAPINWVLINGETRTGATTFFIDKQIDTGNILLKTELAIPDEWTAGELHDELMQKGASLVLETVKGLEKGQLKPMPQDDSLFNNHAPKIFKEDCKIDWSQPLKQVYDFIRGLSPYPAAYTHLEDKTVKVFVTEKGEMEEGITPGTIRLPEETGELEVACLDGWLRIKSLQLQGKKRVDHRSFLNGFRGELKRFTFESNNPAISSAK